MNRVSLQGYALMQEANKKVQIIREMEKLDSMLAKLDTREYISKKSEAYAPINYRFFSFIKDKFTALK